MKIKELLLNGNSFSLFLNQFSMKAEDINIQNEDLIVFDLNNQHQESQKEDICIQGKNKDGALNFFGTLHYNLLNQLAVFEMHGYEKVNELPN
ncbi:hypothetical protein [Pedobacter sp.]|uniref:hypothetical protein n=1 Tax=Pedobacter sp. TaxID=1411316 RepID=UPI003D7FE360